MRGGVAVPEEMSPKGLEIFSRVLESVVRAIGITTATVIFIGTGCAKHCAWVISLNPHRDPMRSVL